ncbi:MAG: LysE family transporter [Gammaproteobacteria bacterium]|nr:LysE family transporter [Gammaproteobacteria bacterium]
MVNGCNRYDGKITLMDLFLTALTGALFVIAVISGIGPQSLTIIGHGIRHNNTYIVASVCFIADGTLILLACYGLTLGNSTPLLIALNVVGLFFILGYILHKVRALLNEHKLVFSRINLNIKQSILQSILVSWLNPLAFIDIIAIIGSNSLHYAGQEHTAFTIGALIGDFIWVFGIATVSYKLLYRLNNKYFWMALDIATVMIMFFILIKVGSSLIHTLQGY